MKLKQALIHLLKNAVEALIQKQGKIDISVEKSGHDAVIRIKDTGVGMSKTELSRLGKPFYTTKSKGTGLGLMVTFRIIETMGGTLEFKSKKKKGTVAIITLPTVPSSELA